MALPGWLSPLYGAEQMQAADRWAIEQRGVAVLELMETAGMRLAEAVEEVVGDGPVRVVCGKGNNGGDGLVAARWLVEFGHRAEVLLLWPAEELPEPARANAQLAPAVRQVDLAELPAALTGSGGVVDALLGTGSSGEPRPPLDAAIEAINGCGAPVVAADIPSGVDGSTGETAGAAVRAALTVCFDTAKVGHLVAPGKLLSGELRVVEIGIPEGAPVEPWAGTIEPAVLALAPRRGPESTKFSSGQVVVAGGSRGLTGAVCMAAEAAIRAGAGYATVAVPASLEPVFEEKLTEVMSTGCPDEDGALTAAAFEPILAACARAGAVVLGPGLGRSEGARELAIALVGALDAPLVLDADGLNALTGSLEALAKRSAPTILTPHAGELGRLLGIPSAEVGAHRLASAREAAERAGAIVVLKGDDTIVAGPEAVAINRISSPALATAGSGDVLGGVIAALVARGMEPFAAACAAVLAHARAGVVAADRIGAEHVVATDLIEAIPAGLRPEADGDDS